VGSFLGEAPGAFCAGELRFLWRRGFVENRYCGCGCRFLDCPVWSEVVARLDLQVPPEQLAATSDRLVRIRNLPALLRSSALDAPDVVELVAHTARAYRAVADVTDARVVIDTSKSPAYALFLEAAGIRPTTYVHLVRDPRAAAWSWSRARPSRALADDVEPMDRFPPRKSALLWLLWNSLSSARFRRGGRYVFARYEDLTNAPRAQLTRLVESAGLHAVDDAVFVDENAVLLGRNHTVAGNPGRRRTGPTVITDDREWQQAMSTGARLEVSAVTLPLMHHYGYRAWLRAA
jgi:hypothetical protein